GRAVGLEADLVRNSQDAFPGGGRHAGLAVQRERHGGLGHPRAAGAVRDCPALHHASLPGPATGTIILLSQLVAQPDRQFSPIGNRLTICGAPMPWFDLPLAQLRTYRTATEE